MGYEVRGLAADATNEKEKEKMGEQGGGGREKGGRKRSGRRERYFALFPAWLRATGQTPPRQLRCGTLLSSIPEVQAGDDIGAVLAFVRVQDLTIVISSA